MNFKTVIKGFIVALITFGLISPSPFISLPIHSLLVSEAFAEESLIDLEVTAKEQDEERKRLKKSEKEKQKAIKEGNVQLLPYGDEDLKERIKRREEAKKRLAYFREEARKRREAATKKESEEIKVETKEAEEKEVKIKEREVSVTPAVSQIKKAVKPKTVTPEKDVIRPKPREVVIRKVTKRPAPIAQPTPKKAAHVPMVPAKTEGEASPKKLVTKKSLTASEEDALIKKALEIEKKKQQKLLYEKKQLEDELSKIEKEAKKISQEETKKQKQLEKARKEEEKRKKAILKAKRKEAEKKRKAELKRRKEEEKKKRKEAERQAKEEKKKRETELKRQREEEKRKKAILEAKRKETEKKRQAELKLKKELEKKKRKEAERQAKEEKKKRGESEPNFFQKVFGITPKTPEQKALEAKRKEADKKHKAALKRQREEEKKKREAELKQKKEEEKRKKAILKAKRKEAEKKRKAELKRKKDEEIPKRAKTLTVPAKPNKKLLNKHLTQAQNSIDRKDFSAARSSLDKALQLDAQNVIATNLMAVAVEGEFIEDQKRLQNQKVIAGMIEEERMRDKFLMMMDRIDSEIQELTRKGNALYSKGRTPEANQKYRKVRALETERRMITENLLERLDREAKESMESLSPKEKKAKINNLLRQADILAKQRRWDEASEKYESVFVYDPLNAQASQGIDYLKKRFIKQEKERKESAAKALDEDFENRIKFYVEQAKTALAQDETHKANVLIGRALALDPKNREAKKLLKRALEEGEKNRYET